jgi:hypothetical protein
MTTSYIARVNLSYMRHYALPLPAHFWGEPKFPSSGISPTLTHFFLRAPEPAWPVLHAFAVLLPAGGPPGRPQAGRRLEEWRPVTSSDLARRIHSASHLTGDFVLRSGRTTTEYFDKYRFEGDPVLLDDIAQAMAALVPREIAADLRGTA